MEQATRQLWSGEEEHNGLGKSSSVAKINEMQMGGETADSPEEAMAAQCDGEFLATIRHVFLSSLNTTYEGMIHHYELPQESGNLLLHSTKMARRGSLYTICHSRFYTYVFA